MAKLLYNTVERLNGQNPLTGKHDGFSIIPYRTAQKIKLFILGHFNV